MNRICLYIFKFLLLFCFFSCFGNQGDCKKEMLLLNGLKSHDSLLFFQAKELSNLAWDSLFVISGPTFDDEVERIIGVNYNKIIEDGEFRYIFTKDKAIVTEFSTHCALNLHIQSRVNWTSYAPNDSFVLKRFSNKSLMEYEIKRQ